jgi:hypothetical protein
MDLKQTQSQQRPQLARLALQLPLHSTNPPDVRHVPLPTPIASRVPEIGTLFAPLVIVARTLPLGETPPSMSTSCPGIEASLSLICT